jgi:peptidoglycan-associated lipoprotein
MRGCSLTIQPRDCRNQAPLDGHSRFLGQRRPYVSIEGHTDERVARIQPRAGAPAEAVRRALALLGVTDSQVEAVTAVKWPRRQR